MMIDNLIRKPNLPLRKSGPGHRSLRTNTILHHRRAPFQSDIYISLGSSGRPDMAFLVTSLIFAVVGIIASICTRICFNQGPSTNLLHLTLVITATVCCWMMWAIVYIAQMKPLIVPILSELE